MIFIYKNKKMKFGVLKSKIEKLLSESYANDTLKTEIKNFKNIVLSNKNIAKIFYLYDELNSNKGLNESIADSFINECVLTYNKTINKIKPSEFKIVNEWVKSVNVNNNYEDIDNLFSDNVLTIESKIKSKKLISESLKKSPKVKKDTPKVPINSLVNIANKTITNYIGQLSESDKKELVNLLSQDDKILNEDFNTLKESVISKLNSLKKDNSDYEIGKKINETIEKVESEKYDKLSYFKLKGLNNNL